MFLFCSSSEAKFLKKYFIKCWMSLLLSMTSLLICFNVFCKNVLYYVKSVLPRRRWIFVPSKSGLLPLQFKTSYGTEGTTKHFPALAPDMCPPAFKFVPVPLILCNINGRLTLTLTLTFSGVGVPSLVALFLAIVMVKRCCQNKHPIPPRVHNTLRRTFRGRAGRQADSVAFQSTNDGKADNRVYLKVLVRCVLSRLRNQSLRP